MSDTNKKMQCTCHRDSHATFVCGHLVRGVGRGFYAADDPNDLRPDAWCAHCDEVLLAEHGWNDVSEKYADITVVCAGCYDEIRKRNTRISKVENGPGFRCHSCGEWHEGIPKDFGFDAPAGWAASGPGDRLTSDWATMAEDRFIRVILELPVLGGADPLVLGVWITQSQKDFDLYLDGMKTGRGHACPPSFGWLANNVPGFPDSLMLKTRAHQRPGNQRPWLELEPTDHPLSSAYWEGLSLEEANRLTSLFMHKGR